MEGLLIIESRILSLIICGLTKFGIIYNLFLEANFSYYAFMSSTRKNLALILECRWKQSLQQLYSVKVKEFQDEKMNITENRVRYRLPSKLKVR